MKNCHTSLKLWSTKCKHQSASSRLPGIGVEQVDGTKGEGDLESGRLWFWGGASVLDLTGEEEMESIEGRLDLSTPAGDLGVIGEVFSFSSGIGLGAFFFSFEGLLLLSSLLTGICSSSSPLESPTSFASHRHLSISCSCMRLMQVESSAIPEKRKMVAVNFIDQMVCMPP